MTKKANQEVLLLGSTGKLGRVVANKLLTAKIPIKLHCRNIAKAQQLFPQIPKDRFEVCDISVTKKIQSTLIKYQTIISCLAVSRHNSQVVSQTMQQLASAWKNTNNRHVILITGTAATHTSNTASLIKTIDSALYPFLSSRFNDGQNAVNILKSSNIHYTIFKTPVHTPFFIHNLSLN